MKRKFLIGSGYFEHPGNNWQKWFWPIWMRNTMPHRTVVIATGSNPPPKYSEGDIVTAPLQVIYFDSDLGSFMHLRNKQKPHRWCGWFGTVFALAMLAYNDESDLIFKESDCLWFGDCIGRMYDEIGDGGIIFGSMAGQPCAQSLFLVKHEYIPEFVRLCLGQGPQSEPGQLGEEIFQRLEERHPLDWKRFSFGVDRHRPLPIWSNQECYYAQKFSPQELLDLRTAGLVTFDKLPEGVEVFSSTPHK